MEPRYKLKTAATLSPVSLADLKRNLRIPVSDVDDDRDVLLQDLIDDAVKASQNATGRQYCPATYTGYLDSYPDNDEVVISKGPVSSVTSVKYYQPGSSVLTTVDPTKWQLDNSELNARLRFLEDIYPDQDKMNVIEIEFIAGYPVTGSKVAIEPDLKQAIILRASGAYLHPENPDVNFRGTVQVRAAELKENNYKAQSY